MFEEYIIIKDLVKDLGISVCTARNYLVQAHIPYERRIVNTSKGATVLVIKAVYRKLFMQVFEAHKADIEKKHKSMVKKNFSETVCTEAERTERLDRWLDKFAGKIATRDEIKSWFESGLRIETTPRCLLEDAS